MKYKLLKQIEEKDSIKIWEVFETNDIFVVTTDEDWKIPITFLISQWYIEKIEDKIIDPKFSVWERVIYEDKNLVFFTVIKWIRILEWEVMYYLFDWFYKEENIKRASAECHDKKSIFNNIYPF